MVKSGSEARSLSSNIAIAENLNRVREQIAESVQLAGRPLESVRLLAISKTFPIELIIEAYSCGQRDFGENRVQEFRDKRAQLDLPDARFHLIGHLQTNKISQAVDFDCIETIDSERLALKLNDACAKTGKKMPVLVEVKLGEEAAKTGVAEDEASKLVSLVSTLEHLDLRGLMTIPTWSSDPEASRPTFRRLRELRDLLNADGWPQLKELSMGMSRDFQIAIQEGATIVRIGTAIFGERI